MGKLKIGKISLEELLLFENKVDFCVFCVYIYNFLNNRFNKRQILDDNEIKQLKLLTHKIRNSNDISIKFKTVLYKNIIKIIVLSKNITNDDFINKISNINFLSLDELYLYLETIIKYSSFCLTKDYLNEIICLFKNDYIYLRKIKNLLSYNENRKITESAIKKLSFLLLYGNNEDNYKNIGINAFNLPSKKLPYKSGKNIITLDKSISPDLDGAFSIEKKGDVFFLDVYITDVPSLLLLNEDLLKYSFNRATSMYNSQNCDELLIRDMLPPTISHDYFSLKKNNYRKVITFSYCIDKVGNICINDISRNLVFINENVDPEIANEMLLDNLNNSTLLKDLKIYRDLCILLCQKSNEELLTKLNPLSIGDIVAVPSILTNYHIGYNSKLAIYREQGKYTKSNKHHYTHSVTPLRRFVSNINLIAYLNQIGIINCPDKYIYYLEDNIDYVIEHLNEQEIASKFFEGHHKQAKKYINNCGGSVINN